MCPTACATSAGSKRPSWLELESTGARLPLVHFLEWVARETGRQVQYDSPETEARVRRVTLHVNSIDLAPVDALEVALASTDIEYSLPDEATILLRPRRPG